MVKGLILGILMLLAMGGLARATDSDLATAQQKLKEARDVLKGAGGGFGGHRERAVEAINHALTELDQAQHVDTRHDAQAEKKANQLQKKDQHLQQRIDQLQQKTQ